MMMALQEAVEKEKEAYTYIDPITMWRCKKKSERNTPKNYVNENL